MKRKKMESNNRRRHQKVLPCSSFLISTLCICLDFSKLHWVFQLHQRQSLTRYCSWTLAATEHVLVGGGATSGTVAEALRRSRVCWESQWCSLTSICACKQKSRWRHTAKQLSLPPTLSVMAAHGTRGGGCRVSWVASLTLDSNTSTLLWHLKFIEHTGLIIQAEGQDGRTVSAVKYNVL